MNNFQKYLSYVYRIEVEKVSTPFNPKLVVAIQEGKYVLNAKNANYSYASLHKVFQQALKKVVIKNDSAILLLGCGAGSIPCIIYDEMKLSPKIDAIEIDEKVIEFGNKYFGLAQYLNLTIVIDDAKNFIEETTGKYDLILVDLFQGIDVPAQFLSQQFFERLKALLHPDGETLLNFVAYNHETKMKVNAIEEVLNNVFTNNTETYRFEHINRVFHVKK